eukprot:Blabericola_migrator_1__13538@NODE_98_length_14373_cov_122_493220_g88_i0_p5_GENE_NODE_98_length_14373_cov_122_493220_g88_i0NODE_98_length_14373_cov_122_493220_g88_i0_p5_ORF_typecomplete_len246_score40_31CENPF_leu_zip/PF10473_9/0_001APG6_N/PF17675_1/1_5APG6_N/PF17675_1/0_02GAS/PF13851_6/0_0076Myosin_tail_1/PF01576_19/0_019Phage_Gp17/PF17549_2/0_036MAD/PF05557_13/0_054SHE3/PF17078_5/0_061HOOK/PF05622_12/0_27GCN5L1/PF06320_13/2_4e03GCN5L1/PF06320_13/0_28GCN5L1/PF06320_13/1_9e02DUF4686/PF15742_5/17Y
MCICVLAERDTYTHVLGSSLETTRNAYICVCCLYKRMSLQCGNFQSWMSRYRQVKYTDPNETHHLEYCLGNSTTDFWQENVKTARVVSREISEEKLQRIDRRSDKEIRLRESLREAKSKNAKLLQANLDLAMKLAFLEKERAHLIRGQRSAQTQARELKELEMDYDTLEYDFNTLSDELKSLKLTHAISEVTRTALEMRVQELETGEQDLEDRLNELEGAKLSVERALSQKAKELHELRVHCGLA